MNQKIRDALCEMGHDEAVIFDGPDFDEAIVGVTDDGRVIYNYDAMVQTLMERDGTSMEDAIAFIEYNTIRALEYPSLTGDKPPIIMHPLNID